MLECLGLLRVDPVRKDLPKCSLTLSCRVRVEEPTYEELQFSQVNWYIIFEHKRAGRLSFTGKIEPIDFLLQRMNLMLH